MYTYDEALRASTEYFGGDDLAGKIFIDKYCLRNNEDQLVEKTPEDMHRRIAREFARIEKKKFKVPFSEDFIFALLDKFRYIIPQGSPMYGIGNSYKYISLSNCYLLDVPLDSYSSILQIDEQLVNISKRRGGVGIDLSNLRPAKSPTRNSARSSTGIATWMERYSNSIREVGQNARRGALMLTLSIHHPDIETFIDIKNDDTKVTGANISIRLTDEFLEAVEKDEKFELRFPVDSATPKISKIVSAKDIWNKIIHSAWLRAEPGLLFWDNVTKYTPADCYEHYKSRSTNPCSEINLSPLDSCRLLCQNLYSYVVDPFTDTAYFDYGLFKHHAKIAQRLMDDLVDLESECIDRIIQKVENDPEPDGIKINEIEMWKKIKKNNDEGRRTGTGITALGDTLAALGIKYGSEASIIETEEIYKTLKLGCYESSVDMAEELGSFTDWDHNKEKDCPFIQLIQKEDPALYERMSQIGRRNIALLTTAPTGTVSCLTQTSSGVEPAFMLSYTRRKKINPNDENARVDFVDKMGDKWQEFVVYHPKVKEWMAVTGKTDVEESPWWGCCAEDIDWVNRVKMQAAAQKHVCHAISSTVNLPEDVDKEEVAKIYETAWKSGCKGITVYRKNCRTGVLVDKKDLEVKKSENAKKRPQEVPGEIYHIKVKGQDYFAIVGLLEGDPYEIFAGKNGHLDKKHKYGIIKKTRRGEYQLLCDDEVVCPNIANLITENEEGLTRIISTSLRHGVPLQYVVHQLEKVEGDMQSFARSIARALKKYVKDGEKVSGESCPSCQSENMVRQEGCITCLSCGNSKCG